MINSIDLVLKMLAFSVLSFLLVNHICPFSFKMYQPVSKSLILPPQSFQILLNESLGLSLKRCLSANFFNLDLHVANLDILIVTLLLLVFSQAFKVQTPTLVLVHFMLDSFLVFSKFTQVFEHILVVLSKLKNLLIFRSDKYFLRAQSCGELFALDLELLLSAGSLVKLLRHNLESLIHFKVLLSANLKL